MTLRSQLNALSGILSYRHGHSINLRSTSVDEWRTHFSYLSRPSYRGGFPEWSSKKDEILRAVSDIHKAWSSLESDLQDTIEPIGEFDGMVGRLNELVGFFQSEVLSIQATVEAETRRLAEGMLLVRCALRGDHY